MHRRVWTCARLLWRMRATPLQSRATRLGRSRLRRFWPIAYTPRHTPQTSLGSAWALPSGGFSWSRWQQGGNSEVSCGEPVNDGNNPGVLEFRRAARATSGRRGYRLPRPAAARFLPSARGGPCRPDSLRLGPASRTRSHGGDSPRQKPCASIPSWCLAAQFLSSGMVPPARGRLGRSPQTPKTIAGCAPRAPIKKKLTNWLPPSRQNTSDREGKMGALTFECPRTGKPIRTGIETDEATLLEVARVAVRVFCPHCREEH